MKALHYTLLVVILILVVGLALAVTRPDKESFNKHIAEISAAEDGNLIERVGGKMLTAQALLTSDYCDYRLWALVKVRRGAHEARFLGIAGHWFLLSENDD